MASKTPFSKVVSIDSVPKEDAMEYRPSVLVVDDESVIADTVAVILSRSGYTARTAYDANEALESALVNPPEILITDVYLPGMNGIDLAITMKRIFPDCKILLFSGQAGTVDLLASAKSAGHSFPMLSKPIHPADLIGAIAKTFKSQSAASAS